MKVHIGADVHSGAAVFGDAGYASDSYKRGGGRWGSGGM